jgi:tetratricopeptide (TPR) repeat protein
VAGKESSTAPGNLACGARWPSSFSSAVPCRASAHGAALPLAKDGLGKLRASVGDRHVRYEEGLEVYMECLRSAKRFEEAEAVALEAIDLIRQLLGEGSVREAYVWSILAEVYWDRKDLERARDAYERSMAISRALRAPSMLMRALRGYAPLEEQRGHQDEAIRRFRELIALKREVRNDDPDLPRDMQQLARLLEQRESESALSLYREAIERSDAPTVNPLLDRAALRIGAAKFMRAHGQPDEAEALL